MLRLIFFIVFVIIGTFVCRSQEHKDTLWTTDKDRIILTYDIRQDDEKIDIKFHEARKMLGDLNAKKYKKLEKVDVVFFDKTGIYKDAKFTNMTPDAFMVPSSLKYSKSNCGYFFLRENPIISFKKDDKKVDKLMIPIYLSYYKGGDEYELFAVCKRLEIEFEQTKAISLSNDSQPITEILINSTMEIEEGNDETTDILTSIDAVETLLNAQAKLPFSDGLQYELTKLRQYQEKTKDRELASKIKDVLVKSEIKKIELEEKANKEAKDARIAAQKIAEEQERIAMARQDSIAIAQEEKAEAEKKRNLWLIIGGVILAGLCFIGNQFLENFRNVRNQRSMMEMQQQIAHRVESEAKRHAKNYARRKTNDVANKVKQSGQDMMRNKAKSLCNKQKSRNVSI